MTDSRALVEHIEALNANSDAWVAEDPENRFAGSLVTIPDHWADYEIYTPAEFDRYLMEQDYLEGYKEIYGVRYNGSLNNVSDEDLCIITNRLYDTFEAEMDYKYETEYEDTAEEKFQNELLAAGSKWDDIAESFDDVSLVKRIFC